MKRDGYERSQGSVEWWAAAWGGAVLALMLAPAAVFAHPWEGNPNHRDRNLLVRLGDDLVLIDYELVLSPDWIAQDAAREPAALGRQQTPAELYAAYRALWLPRILDGLSAEIDGVPLRFVAEPPHSLEVEPRRDHIILRYRFVASVDLVPGPAARVFALRDESLNGAAGVYRLAVQPRGRLRIESSSAADRILSADPVRLSDQKDSESDRRAKSARATFRVTAESADAAADETTAISEPAKPGFDLSAGGIRRLLDSHAGLWAILVLAFLFGTVHALQPGHGKTLVAAYLVGERGTVWHALYLGLIVTLTHTSMVIVLALVVPFFFPDNPSLQQDIQFGLALGCGLIVTAMAVWLLLKRLAGQADHVHLFGGHHDHSGNTAHGRVAPAQERAGDAAEASSAAGASGRVSLSALSSLGVAGGLVPCVDAMGVLLLAYVLGRPWLGLGLVLCFSLGLASVLTTLGIAVVKFRRLAVSRLGEGRLVRSLPIAGAAATLLLGIWMVQYALSVRGS